MSPVAQNPVRSPTDRANVFDLIEGIGTDKFGFRMANLLHHVCGADHCAVFRLEGEKVTPLVLCSLDVPHPAAIVVERYVREGLWRKDPAMSMARSRVGGSPGVAHVDLDDKSYLDLRTQVWPRVRDRVVLCGRRGDIDIGLSVVRTRESSKFQPEEIERLGSLADTLLECLTKHVSVLAHAPDFSIAFTDLSEIESCLVARTKMPRREIEVCARILYGLTSLGIALDLGAGEESIKTYRKRAYRRLQLGSERELILWYLQQWSAWRGYLPSRAGKTCH